MARASDEQNVRSTLGSYRLLGELGRDPLGVLHLACPAGALAFPKWAVVRRLHSGLARDPVMVHAFLAATQSAIRMVHKNLAVTFDFGGKMTLPWSAREHLIGVRMHDLVAQQCQQPTGIPWAVAVYIVAEAADGVAALRARLPSYGPPMGFLTGAVTPSLFVTEAGHVTVVDGCLPLIDGLPLIDSQSLPYRPRGPAPLAANAGPGDAFGLATVLWELIAGRRLFAGRNDDETARLVEANVVRSLRSVSRAPPSVDDVVQRALGKPGGSVFGLTNASDLATELRAVLASEGKRVGADDVVSVLRRPFAAALTAQHALLATAWEREQALQGMGDVPPDLMSDSELTRPLGETLPDTTTETAISRRVGPYGEDGFDDVATMPRGVESWRPELPVVPALRSVPRIEYLPEPDSAPDLDAELEPEPEPEEPSPPVSLWRSEPAVILAPPSSRQPPPSPRLGPPLPPVERAPEPVPSVRPRRAPLLGRQHSSVLVSVTVGCALALALVVGVGLFRRPTAADSEANFTSTEPTSTMAPSVPTATPTGVNTRSAGAWSPLTPPTMGIPVTSPDELPRATEPARVTPSHAYTPPASPPPPAGKTGTLTVFCTPACDQVLDGSRSLGPSPVFKVPVSVGPHRLRMRVDARSPTKVANVSVRENELTVWRQQMDD